MSAGTVIDLMGVNEFVAVRKYVIAARAEKSRKYKGLLTRFGYEMRSRVVARLKANNERELVAGHWEGEGGLADHAATASSGKFRMANSPNKRVASTS